MKCPKCGFVSPEGMNFCGKCATPLGESQPSTVSTGEREASAHSSPVVPEPKDLRRQAERRPLTVLFCDLVGSTSLSERLDPEELHVLLQEYQGVCEQVVSRYDGQIAQYLGDGVLVYFGYPVAGEDDAQRAVSTGLEILRGMAELTAQSLGRWPFDPSVRIGIHSGMVVVGDVGGALRSERLALGPAVNLASRLQSLAEPDTIWISGETAGLVEGFFRLEAQGERQLKGISKPVATYRVLGERRHESRFEAATSKGLSPFVGRLAEHRQLTDLWQQTRLGRGASAFVLGEAGIGKSRTIRAWLQGLEQPPETRLTANCSAFYQRTPLHPLAEMLERRLGFDRIGSMAGRLAAIGREVERWGLAAEPTVDLWADLLAVDRPAESSVSDLSPLEARERTLDSLLEWLVAQAAQTPLLLLVEDLHWSDPSTLDFIARLADRTPAGLLTVMTARPAFESGLTERDDIERVELARLDETEVEELVARVSDGGRLPPEVVRQIVEKTDGIPLFVEELTLMTVESGLVEGESASGAYPELAIPMSLNHSLMARLDRLASAKGIAQLAASVGREFGLQLLGKVAPIGAEALLRELEVLVDAGVILQVGRRPGWGEVFRFKHALIQDAAYDSLLKSTRLDYHLRIARTLEGSFPEAVDRRPELVAHHYSEAKRADRSIPFWLEAGKKALHRSANLEAIGHLRQGLDDLTSRPESHHRSEIELELQTTLGPALMATRGFSSPELGETYQRAYSICRELGDEADRFPTVWGLVRLHSAQGDFRKARQLAEELVRLAEADGDPSRGLESYRLLGAAQMHLGELEGSRDHLARGLVLHDPERRDSSSFLYLHPQVFCLFYSGQLHWLLGLPDLAVQFGKAALAEAERLNHPFTTTVTRVGLAVVYFLRREPERVLEHCEAAITLAAEHGNPQWHHMASVLRGWAIAEAGDVDAGLAEIKDSLDELWTMGMTSATTFFLGVQAEVHGWSGEPERGLAVLEKAIAAAEETGERFFEAELHRLRGELLALTGASAAAVGEAYAHALSIARGQGSRGFELRVATNLAEHQADTSSRERLSGVLEGFTEGRSTPDLVEAQRLVAGV